MGDPEKLKNPTEDAPETQEQQEFSDLLKEVAKGEEQRKKVVSLIPIGESGFLIEDFNGKKVGEIIDYGDHKPEDWGDYDLGRVHKRFYVGVGADYIEGGKTVGDFSGTEADTFDEARKKVFDFYKKHGFSIREKE